MNYFKKMKRTITAPPCDIKKRSLAVLCQAYGIPYQEHQQSSDKPGEGMCTHQKRDDDADNYEIRLYELLEEFRINLKDLYKSKVPRENLLKAFQKVI